MFVTVTLNSGHGISLGPRFFLSSNVGEPVPAEATLSELLAGKVIEVPDSATQIEVASNGACTNSLVLNIGSVPTTTTAAPTTTTAAPTTTTAAPTTTTAAPTTTTAAPETTTTAAPTTTTAAPTTTTTTTSGGGPACTYDGLTIVCDTTTTTTAAPTYSFLRCDVYSCTGGGALLESDVIVRIPTGSPTPSQFSSFRWYYTTPFDNKAYYLTSTSVSGPFYDATLVNNPQTSRSSACSVGATTTTTTTTAAPNTFNVTANGSANYVINGSSNPTLSITEGQTYTFNINASGHPFWIKTVSSTGTGNAYSSGITNNGTDNGTITFVVPYDAPSTLYYNCQLHSAMAGTINVTDVPTTTTTTEPPTTTTEAPPLESVFCDCGAGCAEYFQPSCPPGCEACTI
jgi:hypothetical protein